MTLPLMRPTQALSALRVGVPSQAKINFGTSVESSSIAWLEIEGSGEGSGSADFKMRHVVFSTPVPLTNFDKGRLQGQEDCLRNPSSCGITVSDSGNTNTITTTISPDLNIHIPEASYQSLGGVMSLWADLEFVSGADGSLMWRLSNYGLIQ